MSDTQDTGPLTIEQILDNRETSPETPPVEEITTDPVEPDQEIKAEDATEEEAAEDAETEVEEAPEADDDEGPQVLTLEEYGDVQIQVGDEVTTLKDLQKGTLRQSDYSRKTTELAEKRKQLEAKEAELAETQRQLNAALLDAKGDEVEPDWEKLAEEDPLGWPLERAKWDKRQAEKLAAQQSAQQAQIQAAQEFRAKTSATLLEQFPEWTSKEQFEKGEPDRKRVALKFFSEDEYNQAQDMRLAGLLELAVRGEKASAAANVVEKKLGKAPKVLKPGTSKAKADRDAERKAARQRKLSRPHTIEDVLNAKYG